jgi:hypothetical protein
MGVAFQCELTPYDKSLWEVDSTLIQEISNFLWNLKVHSMFRRACYLD